MRRLINQTKNNLYSTQFDRNRRNGKKTWRTIDKALRSKTPKSTPDAIIILTINYLQIEQNWPTRLILTSQLYVHQAKLIIQTCLHTVCILVTYLIRRLSLNKLIIEQCYNTLII